MSWWVNNNNLSEKQVHILNSLLNHDSNKVCWLKGFPGTGKTLLLTHLLVKLSALNPETSICYITYTNSLVELVKTSPDINLSKINIMTNYNFISQNKVYDYVMLDEIQDLDKDRLFKIKKLSKKIFITGDFDQQIFQKNFTYEDLTDLIIVQEYELFEIFRLTRNIFDIAISIKPDAHIVEGLEIKNTNANSGVKLVQAANVTVEYEWVWTEALRNSRPGNPSVILFPNNTLIYEFSKSVAHLSGLKPPPKPNKFRNRFSYSSFNEFWKLNNVKLMYLGGSYGNLKESDHKQVVYLMSYFSSKGLDFRNVFIPNLNYNLHISPNYDLENPDLDINLLFVAVTRSRQNLFLSYSTNLCHQLISNIPNNYYDTIFIDNNYLTNQKEVSFF
jgi:hypothetical protein